MEGGYGDGAGIPRSFSTAHSEKATVWLGKSAGTKILPSACMYGVRTPCSPTDSTDRDDWNVE